MRKDSRRSVTTARIKNNEFFEGEVRWAPKMQVMFRRKPHEFRLIYADYYSEPQVHGLQKLRKRCCIAMRGAGPVQALFLCLCCAFGAHSAPIRAEIFSIFSRKPRELAALSMPNRRDTHAPRLQNMRKVNRRSVTTARSKHDEFFDGAVRCAPKMRVIFRRKPHEFR